MSGREDQADDVESASEAAGSSEAESDADVADATEAGVLFVVVVVVIVLGGGATEASLERMGRRGRQADAS